MLNLSLPGLDADEIIERLEGIAAVSTGSACTSVCAAASHVLEAMEVPSGEMDGAVRISWSHLTDEHELDRSTYSDQGGIGNRRPFHSATIELRSKSVQINGSKCLNLLWKPPCLPCSWTPTVM